MQNKCWWRLFSYNYMFTVDQERCDYITFTHMHILTNTYGIELADMCYPHAMHATLLNFIQPVL